MDQLKISTKTKLSGSEVIINAVEFFSTGFWGVQTQTERLVTLRGWPAIPWGWIIVSVILMVPFLYPGLIVMGIWAAINLHLLNIVISIAAIENGSEVTVTYPKPMQKRVNKFLDILNKN